jgi:hypothetical protein
MNRRKELIERLKLAITSDRPESYGELCYEILYDLPQDIQVDLCCYMIGRYLLIFEKKYPKIKWPRKVLNDISKLSGQVEDDATDPPEEATMGDSAFIFCFIALKNAYIYREYSGIFTTSCICAILSVVYAQKTNALVAHDPECFHKWKDRKQFNTTLSDNEQVIRVKMNEWNAILEWLMQNRVWKYPDKTDLKMMGKVLEYWKAGDMSLIVPKARKLVEKHRKPTGLSIDDIAEKDVRYGRP